MTERFAITGATGALGRRVVRRLADRGPALRLVVRDPARAPEVSGAEVAVAAFEDEAALRSAFDGARTVSLVSAGEGENRSELHDNAVRAASAAGVERIVYTSFMGASPHATFTFARDQGHTERAIIEAGIALTALRSTVYADYAPLLVGDDGVIRGPAGEGRVAWVAREDIARLAAVVLVDEAHAGQIYDVSGPVAIDLYETARLLTAATGREIRYHPETLEEARQSRAGAEDWQIAGWVGSYAAIATGESSVTSHTVERLTGQRPWTLEEFLNAEPESWQHLR